MIVAFYLPKNIKSTDRMIFTCSHLDSPYLKLKPNFSNNSMKLGLVRPEFYGGAIWYTWYDRDLGLSGRVIMKNGECRIFNIKKPIVRISSLAIHVDDKKYTVNKENEFNDFNKKDNSININNNNEINNNIQINDLKDSMSISIDESKRIELANNLFDQSLTSSIKSNLSSEGNLSLVSNKRKEVADKLFESVSDLSSKKRSLNETFKSNKSAICSLVSYLKVVL